MFLRRTIKDLRVLKLQVRRDDQTRYPMIVIASLSAVPQSCRTPLLDCAQVARVHGVESRIDKFSAPGHGGWDTQSVVIWRI